MRTPHRTALLFAACWLPLSSWACVDAFRACHDTGGVTRVSWLVLAVCLLAPLPALVRRHPATSSDMALMLVLAAYVPVTVALGLIVRCAP